MGPLYWSSLLSIFHNLNYRQIYYRDDLQKYRSGYPWPDMTKKIAVSLCQYKDHSWSGRDPYRTKIKAGTISKVQNCELSVLMARQNCSDIRTEVDRKRPIHCLGRLSVHHLPGVTCHHHRDWQELGSPGWCDAPVQSNVTVSRRTPRWLRAPRVTGRPSTRPA